MYLINITIKPGRSATEQETLLAAHRAWFTKHAASGDFLLLGSYTDSDQPAGIIIAHAENRVALDNILATDSYYPDKAHYEIREFTAKHIAADLPAYTNQ